MSYKTNKNLISWQTDLAKIWSRYIPPARPSKSELKICEEYIKKLPKQGKILILGATPEFRDLSLKYSFTPISADLNPKNFIALKELMRYKGKEKFLSTDWLKFKGKEKYDLILGHTSFNMIPFSKWEKLAKVIHRALANNSISVQVINVRYSKDHYKNILKLFEQYRRKKQKGHIYYEIMMDLVLASCDTKHNYASFETLGKKLDRLFKAGKITRKEYHGIIDVQARRTLKLTLPLKSEIDHLFKKYFSKVLIHYSKDSFSKNCPMYILKK